MVLENHAVMRIPKGYRNALDVKARKMNTKMIDQLVAFLKKAGCQPLTDAEYIAEMQKLGGVAE